MKRIENTHPWFRHNTWWWPDNDEKMLLALRDVSNINVIMQHVEGRNICIQAGGAAGVWPARFACFFSAVHTFEPFEQNYQALRENIGGNPKVIARNQALSNKDGKTGLMAFPGDKPRNNGAVYFRFGNGEVTTITIDSLDLAECDLIQLDIEGHEYEALQGATKTIKACRPVVVVEEKPHPHMTRDYKAPRRLLESMGYLEVGQIARDVIFKC